MVQKKEPFEINCSNCNTNFRLWMPADLLPDWGETEEIGCIKCGARYLIQRGNEGLEVKPSKRAEETAVTEAAPAAGTGTGTLLFVEDDRLATAIAQNTLSSMGLNIVMVKNGKEALEKLENGRIDLIITDLHLVNPNDPDSNIDGEELLRTVARNGKKIPSIITTGKEMLDNLVLDPKWFELNVKGFIQKGNPFWAEELRDKIKEVLNIE